MIKKRLKQENNQEVKLLSSEIIHEGGAKLDSLFEYFIYEDIIEGDFDNLVSDNANYPKSYCIKNTNLTNQPVSEWGWLISYYMSNDTIKQIFISDIGKIYIRQKILSVWQNWITAVQANILWTNPSPTGNFISQSVTLLNNNYNYLMVTYIIDDGKMETEIIPKGKGCELTRIVYDNGFFLYRRNMSYVDDTHYQFSSATLNNEERNWLCIPYQIIGINL